VIGLSSHASRNTAKDNIGNTVDDFGSSVISFAGSNNSDESKDTGKTLQAVVASNELDIILIETQLVLLPNDTGGGTDSGTWT